jgi:hypothetical protein
VPTRLDKLEVAGSSPAAPTCRPERDAATGSRVGCSPLGALDEARVRWSLFAPRETLAVAEGDVDILIEPTGLGALAGALGVHGFIRVPMGGPDVHAVSKVGTSDPAPFREIVEWLVRPEKGGN